MIRLDRDVCQQLDTAQGREWLEANGLGGYAASTVIGLNTRRYHGLLVAATNPPVGRMVLLSKLEETITIDGVVHELSVNRYPGAVHPQGFRYLDEFRLDPFPVFVYRLGDHVLEKLVFALHGVNGVVVEYRWHSATPGTRCTLDVRPLVAFRDYHALQRENGQRQWRTWYEATTAAVRPEDAGVELRLAHDASRTHGAGDWFRNFEYIGEQERGLDYVEDLYCPFRLEFDLSARPAAAIVASTAPLDVAKVAEYRECELARRRALQARVDTAEPVVRTLVASADAYVVTRGAGRSVIAGYHWFGDWGRDTMIALPGLTLSTGRPDVARDILAAFARYVDRGMLPNRFPDAGEAPEYNNVDSTLWYFDAVRRYLARTGDLDFVRGEIYPQLLDIVRWHVEGTRYGIKVAPDGLLASGAPGLQLTWMDAKIGDWVVTPRHGKPVEIQALWYRALQVMAELARAFDRPDEAGEFDALAERARASFDARFWNETAGGLFDVIDGPDGDDGTVRPNQVFAISVPDGLVPMARAHRILDLVERELLTPVGLRTLPRSDSRYRPVYQGGVFERDSSYHQGTVWPWLLGPFISAYLKVHGHAPAAKARAADWIRGFDQHLRDAALGHVSEIFDADTPHAPRGAAAQAWSVAELLRCAVDEVFAP